MAVIKDIIISEYIVGVNVSNVSKSEVTIKGYAKINLALNVLNKRPDGYHEVEMVMQQIDLCDFIKINVVLEVPEKNDKPRITVKTESLNIPTDENNIAYKACMAVLGMLEQNQKLIYDQVREIEILIEKNIPVSAGLAGGSTDAAAAMIGLNIILKNPISDLDLISLGKEIGADVPFCVMGNLYNIYKEEGKTEKLQGLSSCALAKGIGEKLFPIRNGIEESALKKAYIILTKPSISVSTKEVYSNFKMDEIYLKSDINELIIGIEENKIDIIARNMINALENVTLKEYPIVMYTKNILLRLKPFATLMSGSGPSVYSIFLNEESCLKAFEVLNAFNSETFLVKIK